MSGGIGSFYSGSVSLGLVSSLAEARARHFSEKGTGKAMRIVVNTAFIGLSLPVSLIVLMEGVMRCVVGVFVFLAAKGFGKCSKSLQNTYNTIFNHPIDAIWQAIVHMIRVLFITWHSPPGAPNTEPAEVPKKLPARAESSEEFFARLSQIVGGHSVADPIEDGSVAPGRVDDVPSAAAPSVDSGAGVFFEDRVSPSMPPPMLPLAPLVEVPPPSESLARMVPPPLVRREVSLADEIKFHFFPCFNEKRGESREEHEERLGRIFLNFLWHKITESDDVDTIISQIDAVLEVDGMISEETKQILREMMHVVVMFFRCGGNELFLSGAWESHLALKRLHERENYKEILEALFVKGPRATVLGAARDKAERHLIRDNIKIENYRGAIFHALKLFHLSYVDHWDGEEAVIEELVRNRIERLYGSEPTNEERVNALREVEGDIELKKDIRALLRLFCTYKTALEGNQQAIACIMDDLLAEGRPFEGREEARLEEAITLLGDHFVPVMEIIVTKGPKRTTAGILRHKETLTRIERAYLEGNYQRAVSLAAPLFKEVSIREAKKSIFNALSQGNLEQERALRRDEGLQKAIDAILTAFYKEKEFLLIGANEEAPISPFQPLSFLVDKLLNEPRRDVVRVPALREEDDSALLSDAPVGPQEHSFHPLIT